MDEAKCEAPDCQRPATRIIDGHAYCGHHRDFRPELPIVREGEPTPAGRGT